MSRPLAGAMRGCGQATAAATAGLERRRKPETGKLIVAYSGSKGIRRMILATRYSWQGLRAAYRHEEAFRLELWLCILLLPTGIYLGDGGVEKALLAGSAMLLPVVELLNSALEAVIDRIGTEQHELSGRAKDMGSAAVALTMALVAIVWALVLFF